MDDFFMDANCDEYPEGIPHFLFDIILFRKNRVVNISGGLAILVLLAAITAIVWYTGGAKSALGHLFYIPILCSGFVWGYKVGAATGLVSGILAGPWMPLDVTTEKMQHHSNWFLRLAIFVFIGFLAGILVQLLTATIKRLLLYTQRISKNCRSFLFSLAKAIDARDHYTYNHSEIVTNISILIGKKMGLPRDQLSKLFWSGRIHDLGKIGIPNEILRKPSALTAEEWTVMERHSILGEQIINPVEILRPLKPIIRGHHEKWNGSGYPDYLKGDGIPLLSRIITVADVYQALISDRPYRQGCSSRQARMYIEDNSGTLFDPDIVRVFMMLEEAELEKACCSEMSPFVF